MFNKKKSLQDLDKQVAELIEEESIEDRVEYFDGMDKTAVLALMLSRMSYHIPLILDDVNYHISNLMVENIVYEKWIEQKPPEKELDPFQKAFTTLQKHSAIIIERFIHEGKTYKIEDATYNMDEKQFTWNIVPEKEDTTE